MQTTGTIDRAKLLRIAPVLIMALAYALLTHFAGAGVMTSGGSLDPAPGLVLAWFIGHCDGMDGPVVTLARKALEAGNVNLVLPWVQERDESEVRKAFDATLQVRKTSAAARDLADLHFFETLVRIHRAGEGAPYTGLKPAGRDLGPAIPAADRALEDGSIERVSETITEAVRRGIRAQYEHAMHRKLFDPDDVRAGREYVEAYVAYIHYIERLYEAANRAAHGHYPEEEGQEAAHGH